MIMNSDDENYFANLADGSPNADSNADAEVHAPSDEGVTIELTRASTGAVAARPKIIRTKSEKEEEEPEEVWNENEPEGQLTVDVYQTSNEIVVESAIAGVSPDDIDVNVTTDSISIRGSRKREKTVRDADYLYQECYWGKFGRSIILPQEVDPEHAEVKFKNGILTVKLPKANKKKTRKLKIQVD